MANRKLRPGDDSIIINDAKPRRGKDGQWHFTVRYMPHNLVREDGKPHQIKRADKSKDRVREKMWAALAEWRERDQRAGEPERAEWHEARTAADVFREITRPALERARAGTEIGDRSATDYERARLVLSAHTGGDRKAEGAAGVNTHPCARPGCTGPTLTIADLWHGATIKGALRDIAATHGPGTAKQCEKVLGKYVYDALADHGWNQRPPKFTSMGYAGTQRAPVVDATITDPQYDRIRDHLLTRDTSTPLPGASTRYQRSSALQRHASAVTLTLIQMSTGLRIAEACALRWGDVMSHPDSGNAYVHVRRGKGRTRTSTERTAPVSDDRIAAHLLSERDKHGPAEPVVPSPQAPDQPWHHDNANKAVALLYDNLGRQLGIPALVTQRDDQGQVTRRGLRSHKWRSVLNRRLAATYDQELRAALFGHTAQVNRAHYTSTADLYQIERMRGRTTAPAPIEWQ